MTPERLQKVLARARVGSRREVEEMIRQGRVTVDGQVAKLGDRADFDTETVKVDGRRIAAPKGVRRYLLLNKPSGYVSTASDPEGRATVLDLLPARMRKGLLPVGRLDYATEGLLLLTDDGDFAHHVAHPRYGCRKTYEVKVKGHPGEESLDRLRYGVVIDGKRTAPAEIRTRGGHLGPRESQENSWWIVVLGEGRTRQIREMFQRIGHPVSRLRRVAIGPISDPYLPRGASRELTETEVEKLRQRTAKSKARPSRPPRPGSKSKSTPKPPSKSSSKFPSKDRSTSARSSSSPSSGRPPKGSAAGGPARKPGRKRGGPGAGFKTGSSKTGSLKTGRRRS